MNTAPRGNLQINDMEFTAEHLLEQEHARAARGTQRWTMYIREKRPANSRAIPKFFGVLIVRKSSIKVLPGFYPSIATRVWDVGSKPPCSTRSCASAQWVKFIRTDNADSNAPMLKIIWSWDSNPISLVVCGKSKRRECALISTHRSQEESNPMTYQPPANGWRTFLLVGQLNRFPCLAQCSRFLR
jgi:hypothetical protein